MSPTRRHFIRQVSGGMIGGWMLTNLPDATHARYLIAGEDPVSPDDEQFWSSVREQFPLTRDRVYFNTGTVGPSPFVVIEAVKNKMLDVDTRGEYEGWDTVRPKLAQFVNVDVSEISLTHNVTEGINIIASGLPLKRGDEVILTTHEHAGNALPWLNRAHIDGIVIKTLKPAPTAAENLNRITDLITPRTRVIAIPHITCTIGQVFPAKEISRLAHDKGLWVFFDGAHGVGMTALDLKEIDCDFYATCGHKWLCGPKGTGFLYIKKDLLDTVQANWIGAYSDTGWDLTVDPPIFNGYVPTAHRYDFASQNAAIYIGLGAAIDFFHHLGMENIVKRSRALAGLLQHELLGLGDRIEMLTPDEEQSRAAIVGFRVRNMPYDEVGKQAGASGFRVRIVPENGVNCVRVSTHLYNNRDEVMRFVELIRKLA